MTEIDFTIEPAEVEITLSPVEITLTPAPAEVVIEAPPAELTATSAPAELELQITGPPGASAYQAAVAAGFIGDEAAWLASLHGIDGDAGPQNLFVQEAQPVMAVPGLWVELNPDNTVKTMWAGTT